MLGTVLAPMSLSISGAAWTRWQAYPNTFMVVCFEWQSEDAYNILQTLKSA